MSAGEITDKLEHFLASHASLEEECHAVYLMVELRKLIDLRQWRDRFPILKFYADWALHSTKDRITPAIEQIAAEILEGISQEILNRKTTGAAEIPSLVGFSQMQHLREEIANLFGQCGIGSGLTSNSETWAKFVSLLSNVLGDQPIVDPLLGIRKIYFAPGGYECVVEFTQPVGGLASYRQGKAEQL